MGKINVSLLRYLTTEDYRVLTSVIIYFSLGYFGVTFEVILFIYCRLKWG